MRVFLDIGAHEGQTLEEVVKERWAFDEIHAIEPMPRELRVLAERFGADPRLTIHPFALGYESGCCTMYGTNELLEASIFRTKNDVDPQVTTAVPLVGATAFFRSYLPSDAELYVNLNAEGAEIPILARLLDDGEIARIRALIVSFDSIKVAGLEWGEPHIRNVMAGAGFDRYTTEYGKGTHQEQIARWLEGVAA